MKTEWRKLPFTGMKICRWHRSSRSGSWAAWQAQRPSDHRATVSFEPGIPRQQGLVVRPRPHPSTCWSLAAGNKHYRFSPSRLEPIIKSSSFPAGVLPREYSHRRLIIFIAEFLFFCVLTAATYR